MRFTSEQIERGIAVVYGNQVAVCHSADDAITAINGFRGKWGMLIVNPVTEKNLKTLFAGEEFGDPYSLPWLKTTNCSSEFIKLYPALAPTLEEHQKLYKEQCKRDKAERMAQSERAMQKKLADFTLERKGWYSVEVEITVLSADMGRRSYKTFSGKVLAGSKMEAYTKARKQMDQYCIDNCCYLERMADWSSGETQVTFLGMRTDEGYSVEEWKKYS